MTVNGLRRDEVTCSPPVPKRVANPKVREDRAVQDFRQNSEKMHRVTSEDADTKAYLSTIREEGRARR